MSSTLPAEAARADAAERGGIPLFRIAGIRVRADVSWLFLFFLVLVSLSGGYFPRAHPEQAVVSYWAAGLATTLLFFASLLLHELAHAFVALRAGIPVPRITLFLFGGASEMESEPQTPEVELRVAIVGPLMSLLLAGAFWFLSRVLPPDPWYLAAVPGYLAWINLALAIFNMLPGFPLDGGRVLRALVWRATGSLRRATRVASNAGRAFGLALMVLGGVQIFLGALVGGLWLVLIGWFLRQLAGREYEALLVRRALAGTTVADVMTPRRALVEVSPESTLRELVDEGFLGRGYRGFPVVEDGTVVGWIGLEHVRARDRESWEGTRVRDAMTPLAESAVVARDTSLDEALRRIATRRGGRLLVLEGDELVGWVTTNDLTRFLELQSLRTSEPEPSVA